MIEKIKALCVKYREFLVYFIVGCLTTLVAAAARFGFNFLFSAGRCTRPLRRTRLLQ